MLHISLWQYFALSIFAFAVVGFLTPVMRRIAIQLRIYDLPNIAHKSHTEPIPYLGGIAIIIGTLLVSYAALFVKHFSSREFWLESSALAPALILGLIGLWDDIKNLPPGPRFFAQSLAGVFTAGLLVSSHTVGNPTGYRWLDAAITVAWIVGICNSINFFDNVDGGAAGTVAISSIGLAFLGFNGHQYLITAMAAVLAGATMGFLLWNKSPARIYMGDAGALFLGIVIATLTIRLHPNAQTKWTSFSTPLLLLAVPILDTSVAVISRIRRGVSPFQGGKDHLSHRLVRAGMSRPIAVILLWAITGVYAFCAVLIPLVPLKAEEYVVAIAWTSWITLFVLFIRSEDM
jgi:UDP-GlcNAc:undecaprenyl-phosphate GlcNAc-1-phosphate transferase